NLKSALLAALNKKNAPAPVIEKISASSPVVPPATDQKKTSIQKPTSPTTGTSPQEVPEEVLKNILKD
ncbi:MAG: hypothetical protein WCG07_00510, partial [Candidatus Taylorbacteria bacterium]